MDNYITLTEAAANWGIVYEKSKNSLCRRKNRWSNEILE